jgi:hypothetical protein
MEGIPTQELGGKRFGTPLKAVYVIATADNKNMINVKIY